MNQKGIFSYIFVFLILVFAGTFIFVLANPALQIFHIRSYAHSESMLDLANDSADLINDANVKAQIKSVVQAEKDSTTTNVDILGNLYQYYWIIFVVIISIVLFVAARRQVETGGIG